MKKHKIFCAVAILDRTEPMMETSLQRASQSSQLAAVGVYRQIGDSYIMRVRNHAVTAFWQDHPDFDYYAQWSGDIEVLEPNVNVFDRLIEADKDFIGGLYPPSGIGAVEHTSVALNGKKPKLNGKLQKMRWLSGGLWLVKREVISKMIDRYADLFYDGDGPFLNRTVYGLFSGSAIQIGDTKKFLTEDYWFCERWLAMGGEIWADPTIRIRHWGKYGYEFKR